MTRIVISGAEIVSKCGIGRGTFCQNLQSKQLSQRFTDSELLDQISELRKNIPLANYDLANNWRAMDTLTKYAVTAAILAVADADIDFAAIEPEKIGVFIGTVFGCLESNVNFNQKLIIGSPRFVSRTTFSNTVSNAATGHIGLIFTARGPHITIASGGLYPLIYTLQQLKADRIQLAITGGIEKLAPIVLKGFAENGYVIKNEATYESFQPTDGAGMVIVEKLEDCLKRGGRILAEVVSYAAGSDFNATMVEALERANLEPDEIKLILPHTATCEGSSEGDAIARVFGETGPERYLIKNQIGESFGPSLFFSLVTALPKLDKFQLIMLNSASFDSRALGTLIIRKYVPLKEV